MIKKKINVNLVLKMTVNLCQLGTHVNRLWLKVNKSSGNVCWFVVIRSTVKIEYRGKAPTVIYLLGN